ncbi:MAG: PilZ domain-containing protein [Myxococcota bacterium]
MTLSPEAAAEGVPLRLESRERVVHVVEYSHYPRRLATENRRIAYTQDRSDGGLGLDLPERVRPGELLQVTVRDIDGEVEVDGLARVVWCQEGEGGRARAGVSILREEGQRPMMRVRGRSVVRPGSATEAATIVR